jgi:hypothetical protein
MDRGRVAGGPTFAIVDIGACLAIIRSDKESRTSSDGGSEWWLHIIDRQICTILDRVTVRTGTRDNRGCTIASGGDGGGAAWRGGGTHHGVNF